MAAARSIRVAVAWITPDVQDIVPVALAQGATVGAALEASGVLRTYALDLRQLAFAVAGKRRRLHDVVHDGERIDVLRALIVDPKEARHLRARRSPLPPRRPRRKQRTT